MVNVMLYLSVSSSLVTYQGAPETETGGGGGVNCLCVMSLCVMSQCVRKVEVPSYEDSEPALHCHASACPHVRRKSLELTELVEEEVKSMLC